VAVDTTVDNAVIDYTAIASMLQTIKSHDDLFVQFSSGSLGNLYNGTSSQTVPASSFAVAGVTLTGTLNGKGTAVVPFKYGLQFGTVPVVTSTVYILGNTNAPISYLSKAPDLSGGEITIVDKNNATSSAPYTLYIMAMGIKAV